MNATGKKGYLIGPELFDTYLLVLKIVVAVAMLGTLVGNTVDWIFNDTGNAWQYLGKTLVIALNASIGAFGWVTLVFAVIERTAKEATLAELRQEKAAVPHLTTNHAAQYFSRAAIFVGIIFTIGFMIFLNGYAHLIAGQFPSSTGPRFIPVLDIPVFRTYLPYINGLLVLQLLFSVSKLVQGRWTYSIAAANLIINGLSLALLFTLLEDKSIINPDFLAGISSVLEQGGEVLLNPLDIFFRAIKLVLVIVLTIDSGAGFVNAFRNRRSV
ncbi:MAG: hypothetical protein PHG75_02105 [Syntrophomonas sp.]|nr:hypothetical protein [Syntrophomonas sp.]